MHAKDEGGEVLMDYPANRSLGCGGSRMERKDPCFATIILTVFIITFLILPVPSIKSTLHHINSNQSLFLEVHV
jgi:hypothetical protein